MEKKNFKFSFEILCFALKTRPNVVSECLVLENHKKHVLRVITAYMPDSATVPPFAGFPHHMMRFVKNVKIPGV